MGLIGAAAGTNASTRVEIHYAPTEDLETIDARVIDDAERSIDMAAYVLTDARVIEALRDAADRGVAIRLYLDKGQYAREDALGALLAFPNVSARVKGRGVLMHMKAYAIDGARLRTGSGNFSRSGLESQDNDLILVDDPDSVARFERNFDAIWARATNVEIECPREREEGGRRGPPTLCPGQAAPPADLGANSAGRAEILAR